MNTEREKIKDEIKAWAESKKGKPMIFDYASNGRLALNPRVIKLV